MKRSQFSRKSALKPGSKGLARSELKRTAFKSGSSAAIPTTSLHAVSTRTFGKKGSAKRAEQVRRKGIREAVYARDGYRCRLAAVEGAGDCYGPLTPHHVVKASQGGSYDETNLVAACAHHNGLIESDADFAAACRAAGLNKRSWERAK